MKKTFIAVYYFFGWCILLIFQGQDRLNYQHALSSGMHVESGKSDMFGCTFKMNTLRKPERNYLTWSEFWQTRKHWNKNK